MEKISFTVIGQPIPKARARTVRKGGRIWSFTPNKVATWEKTIQEEAKKHFKKPIESPLSLGIIFYLKRPKSRRKDKYVYTTPDLDNLEKSVLDGLSKIAYLDDKLVVAKSSIKKYVTNGKPRIEITIIKLYNQTNIEGFFEEFYP